ncbi:MAG: hypothetical protein GTO22_26020 [Gemmatimonadales bacterium]|nr:hypothetical protein [Gemmatimonadales bacterium]
METAEKTAPGKRDTTEEQDIPRAASAQFEEARAVMIEPDLEFIRILSRYGGDSYKKCFQCGSCSATCPISPDTHPFPRKEMAWAVWGMRDRLLTDPDVWLCHHCNDCSVRCPRAGRPGDVLAAVRRESVIQYAAPRFLARWVNQPKFVPILLGLPAALLGLALLMRDGIESALGISAATGEPITYSYSRIFPHWLLNSFFALFTVLALLAALIGVQRFLRALKAAGTWGVASRPAKGLFASTVAAVRKIIKHDKFTSCTAEHSRPVSHFCVFFGFIALCVVTIWVITGPFNPLLRDGFVYPFSFWSPWKMLANIGGVAVFLGCVLMIRERLHNRDNAGSSSYFDWAFLWTLFAVVLSGFMTELLHYLRMVPHRHVAYFIHLVLVFGLLMYLPYSKFAHLLYRTAAMIYAERYGRDGGEPVATGSGSGDGIKGTREP